MGRPPSISSNAKAETPIAVVAAETSTTVLALAEVFAEVLPDAQKATAADVAALRRAVNLLEEALEPFVRKQTSTRSDPETTALLRRLTRDAIARGDR